MEIAVSPAVPAEETLALAVPDPPSPLPAAASGLAELVSAGEATAERGRARLVRLDGRRVVAAGAGPREGIDADALRDAAAAAVGEARASVGGALAWLLDPALPLTPADQARAVVEGALLAAYEPGGWKTGPARSREVTRLTLVAGEEVEAAAARAQVVARWVNHARDLVNRPGNELTPARLAEHAAGLAGGQETLSVAVLGPAELEERGMGALLAVGRGSHQGPRLVTLRYEPREPARADLVLGLVGKGITFDTGGISLKRAERMEAMKGDMAGGAAVLAGLACLAELGVPLRAVAVVAAAENMPGGGSFRPGDIVTAANGKTIEVTNTDAEGRLVLADALVHARQLGATHLLDLATLTGVMEQALGDVYAGVMGNDPGWRDEVVAAGERSGDHAWPFPLHPRYRRLIDSDFADLKNSSSRPLGTPIYAACFLEEFAGPGPWAHVDMAGPAYLSWPRGDYLSQVGGTGYGVRLIVELATRLASP